ncbi:DSC E3 ubiquitin ligase complex subunit 3 [Cladorrhinum samala]|uniref:DSC E3 ubiquitin ligase complex subunit 3 n=1 Tax=Cladorrhinum samala TaxID=585594 RepID=A0AAV9HME7_9PEZI|nr:DSC E3 ubiquitin ligase complex subunit 3 [Cladorrhinum samala]
MSGTSQNRNLAAGSSSSRLPQDQQPLLPPQTSPSSTPTPKQTLQQQQQQQQQPPLHITVRFSVSLPDIELDIPSPQTTTVVALKHLIRTRLAAAAKSETAPAPPQTQLPPASHASRARLRFIHSGRILPDAAVLSSVLKPPPPQAPPPPSVDAKGKTPLYAQPQPRIFINCSIGGSLSPSDLEEEQTLATTPTPSTPDVQPQPSSSVPPPFQHNVRNTEPRGFDRLAPGMSREEITQLRLTFRNYHASRYTPDNMPSPDRMLDLEDAWLDNDSSSAGPFPGAAAAAANSPSPDNLEDAEAEGWAGNVDNLVLGMSIGFVFPLAAFAWLLREKGLWSRRMQVFVTLGALLSVSVGLVRVMTGGGAGE